MTYRTFNINARNLYHGISSEYNKFLSFSIVARDYRSFWVRRCMNPVALFVWLSLHIVLRKEFVKPALLLGTVHY